MQEMTKRVANMKAYPSLEANVKVSPCESIHKQKKPQELSFEARIGTWMRTWCTFLDLHWPQMQLVDAKKFMRKHVFISCANVLV